MRGDSWKRRDKPGRIIPGTRVGRVLFLWQGEFLARRPVNAEQCLPTFCFSMRRADAYQPGAPATGTAADVGPRPPCPNVRGRAESVKGYRDQATPWRERPLWRSALRPALTWSGTPHGHSRSPVAG